MTPERIGEIEGNLANLRPEPKRFLIENEVCPACFYSSRQRGRHECLPEDVRREWGRVFEEIGGGFKWPRKPMSRPEDYGFRMKFVPSPSTEEHLAKRKEAPAWSLYGDAMDYVAKKEAAERLARLVLRFDDYIEGTMREKFREAIEPMVKEARAVLGGAD